MRPLTLNNELARRAAMRMIAEAPDGYICTVKEPTRTLAQNALMWRMLGELSSQVDWYGQKLTDAEWKDVLTASLKKQKAVPGIDGGFVVLGARTSKMTIAEMSELIELMYAFGAQRGVMFIERVAA
jgi:hypothetical protein